MSGKYLRWLDTVHQQQQQYIQLDRCCSLQAQEIPRPPSVPHPDLQSHSVHPHLTHQQILYQQAVHQQSLHRHVQNVVHHQNLQSHAVHQHAVHQHVLQHSINNQHYYKLMAVNGINRQVNMQVQHGNLSESNQEMSPVESRKRQRGEKRYSSEKSVKEGFRPTKVPKIASSDDEIEELIRNEKPEDCHFIPLVPRKLT